MTEPAFEIRSTKHPFLGAKIWMDDHGHLHIRLIIDNVMDVIFEDAEVVRPRSIQTVDKT